MHKYAFVYPFFPIMASHRIQFPVVQEDLLFIHPIQQPVSASPKRSFQTLPPHPSQLGHDKCLPYVLESVSVL